MALELKISACFKEKCTKLEVSDITGAYNGSTNPTGWGGSNLHLANVDTATLTITSPSGIAVNYDVTAAVQGAAIVNGSFIIDTIDDITFNDGIYSIKYFVEDVSVPLEHEVTVKMFSTCKADCCVEKMKTKFKEEMCGCDWLTYWDYYKQAEALLYAAKSAFACGKEAQATDLLNQVNKICSIQKCCC